MSDLNLKQICNIYNTDKNTYHSYVDQVYEDLFKDIRYSVKKLLEIGVDSGASLFMWREYFENAKIYGIDKKDCPTAHNRNRMQFLLEDAYNYEVVDKLPGDFDIIIDDGPHTLDTITFTIKEYLKKININGILVIEDLQDFHWSNILRKHVPENYYMEIRDLRRVRDRYDDIIMIIRPIKP
jgi:precorrin-6B methylase 2